VITREGVQGAIREWQRAGYSPRTLRHRLRILSQCLATLDPGEPSPCAGVTLPRMPKARPRSVSDTLVREVALNLRKSEIAGRLRDGKTRARYLVLATTGQRPAQLKRATPAAVDLERRIWFVDPAKGDNGAVVYLNDDMQAAWQLFAQAHAWGWYDGRSFVKTLRRNGWPAGIRPYNLRHTVGLALSELGVDLGDIQAAMGHTSPATTRIYVPGILSRLRGASRKLDGRFDPDHYHHFSATTAKKQKAKEGEKRRRTAHTAIEPDRVVRASKSKKSA
jgi:integrase